MVSKKKVFFFFSYLVIVCSVVVFGTLLITKRITADTPKVLGQMIGNEPTITPTSVPTIAKLSPTPIPYQVSITTGPKEMLEDETATFNWRVSGPAQIVKTTTIYYGTTSDPQMFNTNLSPDVSPYTYSLPDFMKGRYLIPLDFIATARSLRPGTYYYRAYALVQGKHYWSPEKAFLVKEVQKNGITVIDPPQTKKKDENITFTWDINGPPGQTGYTAIVTSRESKSGPLDKAVSLAQTPYRVLVTDFTTSTSTIPLRFIGNSKIEEEGTHYFRAVAVINGENIWSDEYSLKIEP